MRYILLVAVILVLVYVLSFAAYSWKNSNKTAAIASAVLGVAALTLSVIAMFFGHFEL